MTVYPEGAGPTAGAFSGEVYQPPAAVAGGVGTTTAPRPVVLSQAATADSSGRMVSAFTAPTTLDWLVRRITVQSDTRGQALVYVGSIAQENLVTGTIAGNLDENDANQPYLVPAGQTIFIHWKAGGKCFARLEIEQI